MHISSREAFVCSFVCPTCSLYITDLTFSVHKTLHLTSKPCLSESGYYSESDDEDTPKSRPGTPSSGHAPSLSPEGSREGGYLLLFFFFFFR